MSWEDVPDDVNKFFETGELPAGESTPPASDPPAADPPPADASAPKGDAPPADPPATDPPKVELPPTNPYAEELIRQQQATLDRLTKQLADMKKAQDDAAAEASKPAPIDPEKDPLGYLTQQIKAVGDQVEAMKTAQKQQQEETTQQTQQRQFFDAINAQIDAFKQKQPDYLDAYKHLVDLRTADFRMRGMTEAQIAQAIGNEELQIVQGAIAQRKNPGELVYALAKQYGYQVKSTTEPPDDKKASSKLDTIKEGLQTTGADRGAPPPKYSTEAVKEMDGRQLTDAVENHWEEMFGRSGNKGIF